MRCTRLSTVSGSRSARVVTSTNTVPRGRLLERLEVACDALGLHRLGRVDAGTPAVGRRPARRAPPPARRCRAAHRDHGRLVLALHVEVRVRALRHETLDAPPRLALGVRAEHERARRPVAASRTSSVIGALEQVGGREAVGRDGALAAPRRGAPATRRLTEEVTNGLPDARPPPRPTGPCAPTTRRRSSPSRNRSRSARATAGAVGVALLLRSGRATSPGARPRRRRAGRAGRPGPAPVPPVARADVVAHRVEARAAGHALVGGGRVVPPLADHVPARRQGRAAGPPRTSCARAAW